MFTFRHFTKAAAQAASSNVRSKLHFAASKVLPIVLALLFGSNTVWAQPAEELDVLRVDIPLTQQSYRGGELAISQLISENTYIVADEFNLRAVEIEAYSPTAGEVRLKVGRYVTPPVPLPGQDEQGLLRIDAPHKTNKAWRLLVDDQVNITSLTAVLEPRTDNVAYYESRYEQRGYEFAQDPYSRQSQRGTWLPSTSNRSASHWLRLNDARSRFQLNQSYGNNHVHSRDCFDRFGQHLSFNGTLNNRQFGRQFGGQFRDRRRTYLHQRRTNRQIETRSSTQSSTDRRIQQSRSNSARLNAERNATKRGSRVQRE